MAKVDLKGLYRTPQAGRVYYYAWRGGPRIKADPADAVAFAKEFADHHAERKTGDKDRLSGLIAQWKASPAWTLAPERGGLADSTKKAWRGPLDAIQREFGKLRVSAFDETKEARRRIRKWLQLWSDRPRAADMHKQVLSALLSFAVDEDELKANPCFGIANKYEANRADLIWTPDDVACFTMAAGAPELTFALELACLTGLRQSDLLRLSWVHVSELAIELPAGKSKVRGSAGRSYVIPMYQELRELLAEIRLYQTLRGLLALTVLTNSDGEPWRGFGSSWTTAMRRFGNDELHFHDARGTFATTTFERQVFTVAELAEMLAWSEEKVERIINRYVRRDALLRDKIRRFDESRRNAPETESVKEGVKTA